MARLVLDGDRPSVADARAIEAVQDMDCLDRAKFRYYLPFGFPMAARDAFPAHEVRYYDFSAFMPNGKDLLTVIRPQRFRLDGVISASHLIVAFDAPADDWPREAMAEIELILQAMGYLSVQYRRGENRKCMSCRTGQLIDCHGHRLAQLDK